MAQRALVRLKKETITEEASGLSEESRRRLCRHVDRTRDGALILAFQMLLAVSLVAGSPDWTWRSSDSAPIAWLCYFIFSAAWALRPLEEIHKSLERNLPAGQAQHRRDCSGPAWLIKTIAGLLAATYLLGVTLFLI